MVELSVNIIKIIFYFTFFVKKIFSRVSKNEKPAFLGYDSLVFSKEESRYILNPHNRSCSAKRIMLYIFISMRNLTHNVVLFLGAVHTK